MATTKKISSEIPAEGPQRMEVTNAPVDARESQMELFDRAARLFREGRYEDARRLFDRATEGQLREVAHNARLHMNMCDRRLQKREPELRSTEDYYNAGVERLNARDFDGARRNLQKAIELTRNDGDGADHVYYAMAACQALSGDYRGAYENLKRAIEIEPRNRVAARQDPDFAGAAQQPPLHGLVYPDRTTPERSSPF